MSIGVAGGRPACSLTLRHCERSEAIQNLSAGGSLDCFAPLAMTGWRERAPYEKNAIFSACVILRIGASASLTAVRGFCSMPLARMVAPSDCSGRGEGRGRGSVDVG